MNLQLTFTQKISYLGLGLFILTAWFSKGFIHPDEHFQILEFISNKLGITPDSALAWEYENQIRPGLAVLIGYGILKTARNLGIENPFMLAFILRLLIAIFSWLAISGILKKVEKEFELVNAYRLLLLGTFFLWFMPYLSVRYSSENLGALFLLTAVWVYYINREKQKNYLLVIIGILFALSFFSRFQMSFGIAGFGLWLLFIEKINLKKSAIIIVGFLIGYCIGVLSDYWLYGEWVNTPYNYFHTNIIEGVAAEFGVSPWWDYFQLFFFNAIPPISIFLFVLALIGIIVKPKNIFVWILIPFLIGHFLVGHKEMRFLFPMAFPFWILAAFGIEWWLLKMKSLRLSKVLFYIVVFFNVLLLFVRSFSPAREIVSYYEYVYSNQDKIKEMICFEEDLYRQSCLDIYFYKSPNLRCHVLPDESHLTHYLDSLEVESIYVLERKKGTAITPIYYPEVRYCIMPDFLLKNNWNDWQSRSKVWKIIELQGK